MSDISVGKPLIKTLSVFSLGLGNVKNSVRVFLKYLWTILNISESVHWVLTESFRKALTVIESIGTAFISLVAAFLHAEVEVISGGGGLIFC